MILALTLERPVFGRRLGLRLSAGADTPLSVPLATESARVLRFPVRLGAYLPIVLGLGHSSLESASISMSSR